jgi:hypothetical protein
MHWRWRIEWKSIRACREFGWRWMTERRWWRSRSKLELMRASTIFLGLAIAGCVVAQVPLATTAPTTITKNSHFTPVGLGSTETMQVNVLNLASNPVNITANTPAASCTGTISFYNTAGTPIGVATTFTITAGQIASATLPFAKAGITGIRGEIRASIQTTSPVKSAPPCSLESSLETFDSVNGATHVYLSNPVAQVVAGIFSYFQP